MDEDEETQPLRENDTNDDADFVNDEAMQLDLAVQLAVIQEVRDSTAEDAPPPELKAALIQTFAVFEDARTMDAIRY